MSAIANLLGDMGHQKVSQIEKKDDRYRVQFTDGTDKKLSGIFSVGLSDKVTQSKIEVGAYLTIKDHQLVDKDGQKKILVKEFEVLKEGKEGEEELSEVKNEEDKENVPITPNKRQKTVADAEPNEAAQNQNQNITEQPQESKPATDYETKEEPKEEKLPVTPASKWPATTDLNAATPNHPTPPTPLQPPSTTKPLARSALSPAAMGGAVPVRAINPYNTFTIKVKVTSKSKKREISKGASTYSVFSVDLVDADGTAVEATFWRANADRWYDVIQEGKVYTMSKFKVMPANRKYSTIDFDYTIQVNDGTAIQECATDASQAYSVKLRIVSIKDLPQHINKKAPVDVLGVLVNTSPLGSVKRKSDNLEVYRRDITIMDQSGMSVRVTLWDHEAQTLDNNIAQQAPNETHPVISISKCRVTEFNGCSLSALSKSDVCINPTTDAANELKSWYQTEGSSVTPTPVGEGLAANTPGGANQPRSNERRMLSDVNALTGDVSNDVWSSVCCTVCSVDADQTLYYLANPDTLKKVTEKDGRYYCEGDGSYCDEAVRRYVMQAQVKDFTGTTSMSLFNREGEQLVGMSADDLHAIKMGETGEQGLEQALKKQQWSQYVVRVLSKAREYKGETRMKHTAHSMTPVNFATENATLLQKLRTMGQATS